MQLRNSEQTNPASQQLLHHALLDPAGLGEPGLKRGEFGVHVAEDGGDGGLFV